MTSKIQRGTLEISVRDLITPRVQPSLEANLNCVRQRIGDAAVRAGRRAEEVHLLAVTKSVDSKTAGELATLGQWDLGESRADELEHKAAHMAQQGASVRWHFIGHLQRNKARRVVEHADVIHSVDSLELLTTIDRLAGELVRRPALFLQVKLHPEAEKSGLDPTLLPEAVTAARSLPNVRLQGLMTMAPLVESSDAERVQAARRVFEGLRDLARASDVRAFEGGRIQLSMGMSADFEVAIEAGSDWVRIGTNLFEGLSPARNGIDPVDATRSTSDVRPTPNSTASPAARRSTIPPHSELDEDASESPRRKPGEVT